MNITTLAPATKTVALGNAAVTVTGLSMRKLTQLIIEYPELLALVAGGQFNLASLITRGPEIGLAVVAVSLVEPKRSWWRWRQTTNKEQLRAFDIAPSGQQIAVLATIFDLTFKGGERAIPFLRSVIASLENSKGNSESAPEPSIEPNSVAQEVGDEISPEIMQPPSSD